MVLGVPQHQRALRLSGPHRGAGGCTLARSRCRDGKGGCGVGGGERVWVGIKDVCELTIEGRDNSASPIRMNDRCDG